MTSKFAKENTALTAPPIAPPITGTILQSAALFPQTKISTKGSTAHDR